MGAARHRARREAPAPAAGPPAELWPNAPPLPAARAPPPPRRVQKLPVNEDPMMEFTLEWMLPTPVPMHVFDQPPIVVEVKNR